MDAKGKIYLDPTEMEKLEKKLVEIPPDKAEPLINGNRAQRRAWYRKEVKRLKRLMNGKDSTRKAGE